MVWRELHMRKCYRLGLKEEQNLENQKLSFDSQSICSRKAFFNTFKMHMNNFSWKKKNQPWNRTRSRWKASRAVWNQALNLTGVNASLLHAKFQNCFGPMTSSCCLLHDSVSLTGQHVMVILFLLWWWNEFIEETICLRGSPILYIKVTLDLCIKLFLNWTNTFLLSKWCQQITLLSSLKLRNFWLEWESGTMLFK